MNVVQFVPEVCGGDIQCVKTLADHTTILSVHPNFAAWYKEWRYRTFAEGATYIRLGGHHIGHRPTF